MGNGLITDRLVFVLKRVFLALLAVQILIFVCACSDVQKDDTYEDFLSDISVALNKDSNKIDKYRIIVAEGSCSEIYEAAKEICDKIKDKTGVHTELCYDTDQVDNTGKICYVLIGKSGYTSSFLRDYKVNDFGYCYIDGTVFVGGISDEATLRAISKFNEDILGRDRETLISETDSFYVKGEYEIDYVELNGLELGKYVIAYDPADTMVYSEALLLRDEISRRTGYYLEIFRDVVCSEETKAICVGRTTLNDMDGGMCAENEARIIPYPNGVSVVADTHYGLKLGLSELSGILMDAGDSGRKCALIEQNIHISFSSVFVRTVDIDLTDVQITVDGITDFLNLICEEKYDFVRVKGISPQHIEYFSEYCKGIYETNRVISGERGIYYLHLKEKYSLEALSNKGVEGLDAVHTVYADKSGTAKIDMLEVYPSDPRNEAMAIKAADIVGEFMKGKDMSSVIINSSFASTAENLFANKIAPASVISALSDKTELVEHRVYLAGAAIKLNDCNLETLYNMQIYFKDLTVYAK